MIDQLDVFLQHETRGFVDTLFVTLENKSYLQSNPEAPAKKEPSPVNGATPEVLSANLSSSLIVAAGAELDRTGGDLIGTKVDDKKVDLRKKTSASDKDDRRPKRRSWSSRSRSRSRSRERIRRSRSRDRVERTRDGRGGRGWEDRRRRSPIGRRMDRRRSRTPPLLPSRRSRSPRPRRAYRTRSRSPKATSPRRSPLIAVKPADGLALAPISGSEVKSVTTVLDPTATAALSIQSVVVAPMDKRPKFRCRDYDGQSNIDYSL